MAAKPDAFADTVRFTLDGQSLEAVGGETILEAAKRVGVEIPHLCYKPGYRPDGNCRACVVEIDGERVLAPSCCRAPTEGMDVKSTSERAVKSQKLVLELLKSDMPAADKSPYTPRSELDHWCDSLEIGVPRFPGREQPKPDLTNPAIAVNLDACIQCTRCVRACREEQVHDVIGYAFRGSHSAIVFDIDDPMGDSTCVSCGECVQACPTGALMPARQTGNIEADKKVDSTCPYCGVGCLLTYNVKDGLISYVDGRDGPANQSRLCVKGRYGFDYVHHKDRLTTPLIRRPDAPKSATILDDDDIERYFRPASWDEALDVAAQGFLRIREQHGSEALAGFGSAKGSNEEAYLFQKLIRTAFKTNNVDHCTRLCHASSVAALMETVGSGAVSNQVADVAEAEVIMIIGARPTVNHPVAATFMKNAVKAGKKLIYMDPYRSDLARHATHFLQFHCDTDVPLLNAMMYTIIDEGLQNDAFITDRTSGYEALKETVLQYPPEKVATIVGVSAESIREAARLFATASGSMIFWGMGVSQHIHGTDNARCLISLALLTGQIGRPGTGLHPLRGQNNVQGASDVGLIPMVFPDYRPVEDKETREFFEELWGMELNPNSGLTVVEIMEAVHDDKLHGVYIMGENPAMSDPNLNHAREALAKLEHLVVQEIFFTETAGFADVILPASAFPEKTGTFTNTDRRVQLGRQAIEPPGEARQDLDIIQALANRLGLDWNYDGPAAVFEEIRKATPSMGGITWERLETEDSVTYPCENEGDPGESVIFTEDFPTEDGRGKFVPADFIHAAELPDEDFPFIFITGRQLEHWHTGAMTRNASVLNAIEPEPVTSMNPEDLREMDIAAGTRVRISSRRGTIVARVKADAGMQRGSAFMAFCYVEAAANLLTHEELDPFGKIPEFKYTAVRLEKVESAAA
ncbi:MAG: formate dehydrogenase subunit alpha [Gammaproteobacteria bacterium]|nr:formate dehydrogenase subunit alpha [Gammaproteobacteria bacterium]NNL99139.1 formate dehydrogenase subunit alpha [Gammaproteobacteria bacterium]